MARETRQLLVSLRIHAKAKLMAYLEGKTLQAYMDDLIDREFQIRKLSEDTITIPEVRRKGG